MSETQSVAMLTSRLNKLERQNRWIRGCLVGLFAAGLCAMLLAANVPDDDTLEAKQITIRDADGNKRIVLGREDNPDVAGHRVGVFVYDAKGDSSVNLMASRGQAGVNVEQNGKHRLSLGTGKEKYAGLLIYAEAGTKTGQMLLFYTDDGKPMFGMNDRNGNTRIMMGLDSTRSEKPFFALQDANQESFFAKAQP